MITITGILKWILIGCVSATTIAIVVSGTILVFQEVIFFLLDKIKLGRDKNKQLFKYYWVRRDFEKWVKENKSKGIDVKTFKYQDGSFRPTTALPQ